MTKLLTFTANYLFLAVVICIGVIGSAVLLVCPFVLPKIRRAFVEEVFLKDDSPLAKIKKAALQ